MDTEGTVIPQERQRVLSQVKHTAVFLNLHIDKIV